MHVHAHVHVALYIRGMRYYSHCLIAHHLSCFHSTVCESIVRLYTDVYMYMYVWYVVYVHEQRPSLSLVYLYCVSVSCDLA
jgi:hypothetical protein